MSNSPPIDNHDEAQLARFGYKQQLHRTWGKFEGFMASFGSLYVVGGVRALYATGIYSGGPEALWTSMLVTGIFATITAASLAEICSSIPLSGSSYIWAAESAGKKYGRFFGFIVAFWVTTAWTSFAAFNTEATATFMLSELTVFNREFPGGISNDNVKWRAVVWIASEVFLLLAVISNLMPPNRFSLIFKASALIIAIDFLLTVIWLPIGVSKTYGFQSAAFVFKSTFNGTGAGKSWNWILSYMSTCAVLTGFDAAGHIAEETKDASRNSAKGIFWSAAVSALVAFPLIILFLFCSPSMDVLFTLAAPQPFVLIYQLALGKGGQLVMTLVAVIGLQVNTCLVITAASRLIFAIARDGVLPGSKWIGKVDDKGQPRNAVLFIGGVSAFLLCTILPSTVAFTSLISAGVVPNIATYALIPILRLTFTRQDFKQASWSLGWLSTPFCVIAALWNLFLLSVLFSPYIWPVSAQNFNFSSLIFGSVTIMGVISWWFVPEKDWLSRRQVARVLEATETDGEIKESKESKRSVESTEGEDDAKVAGAEVA